jgi:hypothetical protein
MKRLPVLNEEATATNLSCPADPPHFTENHQSSVAGVVWLVQVMPSGLVITRSVVLLPGTEPSATATNFSCPAGPPHVTDVHVFTAGAVRGVQVIPSGLVMTRLPEPELATATKSPFPNVTDLHALSAAEVRVVQVIPSVLVMTRLPEPEPPTATNNPFPKVTEFQMLFAAAVRVVQVMPSVLVMT